MTRGHVACQRGTDAMGFLDVLEHPENPWRRVASYIDPIKLHVSLSSETICFVCTATGTATQNF
jgi:hypothetical protein